MKNTTIHPEVADHIKEVFKSRGLSQADAAKRLGVSPQAVSIQLRLPFGRNVAKKWSRAFGFDPDFLMYGGQAEQMKGKSNLIPLQQRSPELIREELINEFDWNIVAMAANYNTDVRQMSEMLQKGGTEYRNEEQDIPDKLVRASFDVGFAPIVNVKCDVKDPYNLTEEEENNIVELAIEAVINNLAEKISGENVNTVRLYEILG